MSGFSARHDYIHVAADQLGSEGGEPIQPSRSEAHVEHYVLSLDIAKLTKSFLEGVEPMSRIRSPHRGGLLRGWCGPLLWCGRGLCSSRFPWS